MQFPRIHLNGTSPEGLKTPLRNAYTLLGKAIEAMGEVTPHARDYYVISDSAATFARAEHVERLQKIESVRADLLAIFLDIERQEKERNR